MASDSGKLMGREELDEAWAVVAKSPLGVRRTPMIVAAGRSKAFEEEDEHVDR